MDLSLTNFSYAIPIRSIQTLSKSPPILSVAGSNISIARSIEINDIDARFEVVSKDKVLVEVPTSVVNAGITSIVARSSGPVAVTGDVSVGFSFEELATTVAGISALVQRFLKLLLTTKTTSYQNIDEGGGVLSMVAASDGEKVAKGLIVDAVTNVEQYMKDDPKFSELAPSERLLSAETISAEWSKETQTISLVVRITNQLGETLESGVSI